VSELVASTMVIFVAWPGARSSREALW
jgi:hypothetical protein